MSNYWSPMGADAEVTISWHLRPEKGYYLLTMHIGTAHSHAAGGVVSAAYPQAHAVVNDFGDLVITTAWH